MERSGVVPAKVVAEKTPDDEFALLRGSWGTNLKRVERWNKLHEYNGESLE